MVRYTVAVCNYNMAETLERSLRSILDQVDDRFEVVVVDGGSTDGSRDVLRNLRGEYDGLRIDLRDRDTDHRLGGDRNRSFELADGEYVLESLDCDNRYFDVVEGFTEIYHEIESHLDGEFLLSGMGFNMAPRRLLLDVEYRDLGGAEDRDLFRRLAARDAVIWLERCGPIAEQIGYEKGLRNRISRDLEGKACDLLVGVTLPSALAWSLSHEHYGIYEQDRGPFVNLLKRPYDFVTYLYAYLRTVGRERFETPEPFDRKGTLERVVAEERVTLPELADDLGIDLDLEEVGTTARTAYCLDT